MAAQGTPDTHGYSGNEPSGDIQRQHQIDATSGLFPEQNQANWKMGSCLPFSTAALHPRPNPGKGRSSDELGLTPQKGWEQGEAQQQQRRKDSGNSSKAVAAVLSFDVVEGLRQISRKRGQPPQGVHL